MKNQTDSSNEKLKENISYKEDRRSSVVDDAKDEIDQMRDTFHTITDGAYSELLFKLFGKERVEAELEEFLKFDFFPRVGGGIGMTRMIAALDTI